MFSLSQSALNVTRSRLTAFIFTLLIAGCGADEDSSLQETSSETITPGGVETTIGETGPAGPEAPTIDPSDLIDEEAVLFLVNDSRTALGLKPLVLNDELNDAAYYHSLDMSQNNYFDHIGLNGSRFSERTEDAGYQGQPRGENIASGQRSPQAVHDAWMNSQGHRENILREDITEMGLGREGNIWTQIFGRAI